MIGYMGAGGVLGFSSFTAAKPRSIGTARVTHPILGTAKPARPILGTARTPGPAMLAIVSPGQSIIAPAHQMRTFDGPSGGGGNGLPGSSSGSANDAIGPAPQPSAYHPGLDPAAGGASGGGPGSGGGFAPSGGEGASDPGGDTPEHGSTFGVKATFPTWALVAGGVVFAGLAAFALHRTLPRRGGSKKAA